MNTFPPPPQMQPGGFQNLPARNPRTGRQPAPSAPKKQPPSKGSALSITKRQGIVLAVLFAVFAICLSFYLYYNHQYHQVLENQMAKEREYQREVARHKVIYEDKIRYYAAVNDIDPAFVAAIIKRESDYDPNAISRVFARGLMQIMPDTGEWLAGKVDVYDFTVDLLFDPEINIKMGCWYLGYLSRKFDGDPITIACAYHAGQGNVEDHWLKKYSSNGKTLTIDEIPTDDTKYYARKVMEAYAIYQQHHY